MSQDSPEIDLPRIIHQMKTELRCLESAIAAMEELARVQGAETVEPPLTKRRGRPQKPVEPPPTEEIATPPVELIQEQAVSQTLSE